MIRPIRHGCISADEQAALRRVATLVARGSAPEEVFAAVTEEVERLLRLDTASMSRYEYDGTHTLVAISGRLSDVFHLGQSWKLGGRNISTLIFETGRPARLNSYSDATGTIGVILRELDLRQAVGAPIIVEDRLWGSLSASLASEHPLPADTEARLASFTELVAAAIANIESRAALARLAEEQAALRRVATLVARGEPPEAVFTAVLEEVGRLLPVDLANMCRYEPDRTETFVGAWGTAGERFPVGSRWPLEGYSLVALVFETGRPARLDRYDDSSSGPLGAAALEAGIRSAVGAPILVEGNLWGAILAGSTLEQPLPPDTEARLASFTELVATAIANTDSRAALARLADEQAALRQVATLVARATPPEQVFAAVAEEVGGLLEVDYTVLIRSDPQDMITVVGGWTATGVALPSPVGSRFELGGRNVSTLTLKTGRPARLDAYVDVTGSIGNTGAHDWGFRSSVGVPISVEGRPWGLILVAHTRTEPLPAETEARLAGFTELVATAIANTEAQAELTASRARIVAAADTARRRIERDLHDGAQQRLVSLALQLRASTQTSPRPGADALATQMDLVAGGITGVLDELREIARGIHPAVLAEGGLRPALRTLARRSPVPVRLDLDLDRRLPEQVELAAYYVVNEALTNTAKHAHASAVHVELDAPDATLRLAIRDNGIGGADPSRGSGLTGLRDRIEAFGGTLDVTSPTRGGTTLLIEIPV